MSKIRGSDLVVETKDSEGNFTSRTFCERSVAEIVELKPIIRIGSQPTVGTVIKLSGRDVVKKLRGKWTLRGIAPDGRYLLQRWVKV